jgi:hypothetical protein
LNQLTPLEAAKDPKYRVALEALIGHLELADQVFGLDETLLEQLRQKLGLPQPVMVDPPQGAMRFTALKPLRIRWESADDDRLIGQFFYSVTAGIWSYVRLVGKELLRRTHLEGKVPFEEVCQIMSTVTRDDEQSLNYLRTARKHAQLKGQPMGPSLVSELEWRMRRGIVDKTEELFEEIRMRHMNEPGVAARIRRLLISFGFGGPGMGEDETDDEAVASATEPSETSGIWTPQSATSGGTGKLWLPGSE